MFSKIRKVIIANDTNYSKCIQTILSTLNLYLDLSVLDLATYINDFFKFFLKFYGLLVKLKTKLIIDF